MARNNARAAAEVSAVNSRPCSCAGRRTPPPAGDLPKPCVHTITATFALMPANLNVTPLTGQQLRVRRRQRKSAPMAPSTTAPPTTNHQELALLDAAAMLLPLR